MSDYSVDNEFDSDEAKEELVHPKEIADSTLQRLLEFTRYLEHLCQTAADLVAEDQFFDKLINLIDGISTFTEAITTVKKLQSIHNIPAVNQLEASLLNILKDLLSSQEKGHYDHIVDILNITFPEHLAKWREVGIPTLIRARDS